MIAWWAAQKFATGRTLPTSGLNCEIAVYFTIFLYQKNFEYYKRVLAPLILIIK